MRPLTAVERFFERLFERPSARLFRARLQPVQLQRRIERAMETRRLSGADRTMVPNRFRVHLNPADLDGFGEFSVSLAAELADGALAFARSHRYSLVDRPRVDLIADSLVPVGEVRVEARFADPDPSARPVAGDVTDDGLEANGPGHATRTMVFKVPVVEGPIARLREIRPDGTQREVEVDGALLTIGRGNDNGLVIHDSRISRHHARLQARRGTLVLTDLGSTNGLRVNGVRVDEVVLGEGDQIELGDTVLVVESVAPG
ncbi:MAG: FHA domain-containing protein [Chloroflexota bacterium]|nr:FHA domain-containing protein [Chloroflexota bacterium]